MLLNVFMGLLFVIVITRIIMNRMYRRIDNNEIKFLDKGTTNSLKGFAILMIVLAHICQYEDSLREVLIGGTISYILLFSWGAIGVSLFFLLSGYGCYLSLLHTEKYGKWLIKHIVKVLIHFTVVFIPIICTLLYFFHEDIKFRDCWNAFITLRLPGSTVWYLKIQILFYIILVLSMFITRKKPWILVGIFSMIYSVIANYPIGLPDYWWKTSLCFVMGCFIAEYKEHIERLLRGNFKMFGLLAIGCFSYIVILKDSRYIFLVQLLSYMILSFCITLVWNWLLSGDYILEKLGKYSLDIYLVHIGIVEAVFLLPINMNVKVIFFAAVVIILTVMCYKISEFLYVRIQKIFSL